MVIEISYTGQPSVYANDQSLTPPLGTSVLLKPGIITGGLVTHDCPLSHSIGYLLEPIIMLAPFAKKPLELTIMGVTTDNWDLSVCAIHTP